MTLWRHARKWPRAPVIGGGATPNFSHHRGEKGIAIWEERERERDKREKDLVDLKGQFL